MDLAELSEQSSALPDQFWAPKGEAKSAEPTDDRSYLMFEMVTRKVKGSSPNLVMNPVF